MWIDGAFDLVLDAGWKATVLLGLALTLQLLLGNCSAAARGLFWVITVASLISLPATSLLLPAWKLPLLPRSSTPPGPHAAMTSTGAAPASPHHAGAPVASAAAAAGEAAKEGATSASSPLLERIARAWKTWAVALWLAGAGTALLPFLAGSIALSWLMRRATPIDRGPWASLLRQLRTELELRVPVKLLEVSRSRVPMTWGFRRPVVLLPAGSERWPEWKRRSVLVHELAHVARRDCLIEWLSRLACALYWYHPFVWAAARRIRIERERACDDEVLRSGASAPEYAGHLLELARESSRRGGLSGAALAMARPSQLEERLLAILDEARCRSVPARTSIAALLAFAACVVLPLGSLRLVPAQPDTGTESQSKPEIDGGRSVDLLVVASETRQPLAGTAITAWVDGRRMDLKTDSRGGSLLPLPAIDPRYVTVHLRQAGRVPVAVQWGNDRHEGLPSTYTFALELGTTIGGKVIDEGGQPIAGATVFVLAGKGRPQEWVDIRDEPAPTDARGEWSLGIVPAEVDHVSLRIVHAAFASDLEYRGSTSLPALAELRARTAVSTLRRGHRLDGRIADAAGKPIEGALVTVGTDHMGSNFPDLETGTPTRFSLLWYGPRVRSDAGGRFRLPPLLPGDVRITVQAEGHAPETRIVHLPLSGEPLGFVLGGGQLLRGRVVDPGGHPIAGAFVAADRWRDARALDWRALTDRDGSFKWRGAPADGLLVEAGKAGYKPLRGAWAKPSESELLELVLEPEVRIAGGVRDAATGEVIRRFRVLRGVRHPGGAELRWDRAAAVHFSQGLFALAFDREGDERRILVEADGYAPFTSAPLERSLAGPLRLDVSLQREGALKGTARLANGLPAAGAVVIACLPASRVHLRDVKLDGATTGSSAVAGADGGFAIDPPPEAVCLVVLHEDGYAEALLHALRANPDVIVRPWGAIAGSLRQGSGIAARRPVELEAVRRIPLVPVEAAPSIVASHASQSGADGSFRFERVLPGQASVGRVVESSSGARLLSHSVSIEVRSGEVARPVIGGLGRPVTGRLFVSPGAGDAIARIRGGVYLRRRLAAEEEAMGGFEAQLAAAIERDGAFRIEDVPPGSYVLEASLREPPGKDVGFGETVASVAKDVDVPGESDGAVVDVPLDLGFIEALPRPRVRVGQPAPAIDARTLDGKPLRLEDFRGKLVLIDFWATWCGPCLSEIASLKEIHRAFAKDGRFTILSLSLDEDIEAPQKHVAGADLPWVHGFLGKWEDSTTAKAYGVPWLPHLVLVGPDGKVVARNLIGVMTKNRIAEALAAMGKEGD